MANNQLKDQVLDSIVRRLGIETLKNNTSFYYDVPIFASDDADGNGLGLDSIDAIEIIIAVKEDFDVKITDNDMEALKNVTSISNFIEKVNKA